MLSLLQNRQSTPFSGYDASSAATWASIQSICGVTYPTEVQAPAASPTSVFGYANSSYSSTTCLSGNTYTVAGGDTCQAIAATHNVATGTLITLNQLLPGCTDIQAGQEICLPQSCTTYTVAAGDTCFSIAAAAGISYLNLLSWNPSVNNACTNLIADTEVCLSIPGGSAWNGTTIAGATATQTAAYATTTAAAPGATASGTTLGCGKYYQVVTGDICQLVALNNSISVSTFEAINPSIDEACDNLIPGLYYCVLPTADWNVTSGSKSSSTTVSPPAPTATGKLDYGLFFLMGQTPIDS
jgi:LysM repeat protein